MKNEQKSPVFQMIFIAKLHKFARISAMYILELKFFDCKLNCDSDVNLDSI